MADATKKRSAVRKKQECPICGDVYRPTRCHQRTCGVACSIILRRQQGNLGRPYAEKRPCAVAGCDRHAEKRGLCSYHYQLEPDQARAKRSRHLMRTYGVSLQDVEDMLKAQGGVCAICGGGDRSTRWHLDHCHETGRVRGILCPGCNTWLGKFEKPGYVERAQAYLSR